MAHCPLIFLLTERNIISALSAVVVKRRLCTSWQRLGQPADAGYVVLTSTHILCPADGSFAGDVPAVQNLWQQGRYAVIGTPEFATGKLTLPPQSVYEALKLQADVILCEADGSRHHPCKVPAEYEPVILPDSDIVLAVAGMDALGNSLQQACQRPQLAAELLCCSAEKNH